MNNNNSPITEEVCCEKCAVRPGGSGGGLPMCYSTVCNCHSKVEDSKKCLHPTQWNYCMGFGNTHNFTGLTCSCECSHCKPSPLNQAPEEKKECKHLFWKDRNPANCMNCGKTEMELFDMKYELKKIIAEKAPESKEWEEEFDEEFSHFWRGENARCMFEYAKPKAIKSFISNQLDKWGQKEYNRGYEDGKNG